ncbi:hypothetical protein [Mesorhizobium sp. BR1-1-7]|uniref:hypothetical protein n=1 Tax=Mesorhizobium sp. BR1-1-7 TaxID=2876647 RepID=UPI001CCE81A1|nr:hypothetical protein [Mesorhizobium sp. BR1-1-7]
MVDDLAPFESPKELIQGAKENLVQLEADCVAFGDNCPYEFVSRIDNKAGERIVALRLQRRMPPRIRRIASTILKESRLALDQAMCDAAIELGRKDAKNVYFPFGKSVADLRHSRREKCRDVDRRIVAFALRFKPYYGGNPLLWTLARLATHSHQRIVAVRPEDAGIYLQGAILQVTGPMWLVLSKWCDLHNEMQVARLPGVASITLNPDAVLSLDVVFGASGEAVADRPLVASLNEFIGIAERIVLGLEAETARLKAITTI